MDSNMFEGIGKMIIGGFLIAIIISFSVGLISSSTEIKSQNPIIPEIEISIKNGIADTLYIYKKL